LIPSHPRTTREEKPKCTHRQVLVCLHRSLPRELFAKISLKLVQAICLVKKKMKKFQDIFAARPGVLYATSSGSNESTVDLTQALGSARVSGAVDMSAQFFGGNNGSECANTLVGRE
jgi:hypothetical protein